MVTSLAELERQYTKYYANETESDSQYLIDCGKRFEILTDFKSYKDLLKYLRKCKGKREYLYDPNKIFAALIEIFQEETRPYYKQLTANFIFICFIPFLKKVRNQYVMNPITREELDSIIYASFWDTLGFFKLDTQGAWSMLNLNGNVRYQVEKSVKALFNGGVGKVKMSPIVSYEDYRCPIPVSAQDVLEKKEKHGFCAEEFLLVCLDEIGVTNPLDRDLVLYTTLKEMSICEFVRRNYTYSSPDEYRRIEGRLKKQRCRLFSKIRSCKTAKKSPLLVMKDKENS